MMTQNDSPPAERRVNLTINTANYSSAVVTLAVEMASLIHARLQGRLIEDTRLLSIADLPFTTEITLASASSRTIDAWSMRRSLQAASGQIRDSIARAAEQANIAWSFDIIRNRDTKARFTPEDDADMFVLAQAVPRRKTAPNRALLFRPMALHQPHIKHILLVGSDISIMQRAVDLVARQAAEDRITVTLISDASHAPTTETGHPLQQLEALTNVKIQSARTDMLDILLAMAEPPGYILTSRREKPETLEKILATAGCPVVLLA